MLPVKCIFTVSNPSPQSDKAVYSWQSTQCLGYVWVVFDTGVRVSAHRKDSGDDANK